jgi:hypothetical protein
MRSKWVSNRTSSTLMEGSDRTPNMRTYRSRTPTWAQGPSVTWAPGNHSASMATAGAAPRR